MLWRLLVVAVRPLHLGAADPAPFGHPVLVMLSRLPVALEAVDGRGVDAFVLPGHDDVAEIAMPGHLVKVSRPGFALAQLARRGQAAAMAGVHVHVALAAPSGALLRGTLVLGKHPVDRSRGRIMAGRR